MQKETIQLASITKKIIMSLAGLFLFVFLTLHLTLNLLILKGDQGQSFIAAANFMQTNELVEMMEMPLFAIFILHMFLGVWVSIKNLMARPVNYKVKGSSEETIFSKYILHTGIVVGIFLSIHLMNFYFIKEGFVAAPDGIGSNDMYNLMIHLFKNPVYSIIYIGLLAFMGFHLVHAFQSAFQTLGINHKIIKIIGVTYSLALTIGFIIIPIGVYLKS